MEAKIDYVRGLVRSVLVLLLLFESVTIVAQTTVTVVDGNAQNLDLPIDCYYAYTYSQQLYLQSEIGVSGDITTISFEYDGYEAFTDDIKIYMGHTSKTEYASTSDWVPLSGMTLVYDGQISVTTTAGWVTLTLDNSFTYNNTDNLVIAVDENTAGYHSASADFYTLGVVDYRSLLYSNDWVNPDPASPPSADYNQKYVPSLQLGMVTCNSPVATSNVVENCGGGTFSVEVTLTSYGDGSSADLTDGTTTVSNASLNTVYTFGPYSTATTATVQYNGDAYGGCDVTSGTLGGCVPNTCTDAVDLAGGNIVADFSLANNDDQESDSGGESTYLQVGNGTTIVSCASGVTHSAYDYTEYKDLWYKVIVPSGEDEFTLSFSNVTGNYVVVPYYGTCGSLTQMTLLYNSDQSITGVIDNDGNNWFGDDPYVTPSITTLDFKGSEILNAPGGVVYLRIFPYDGGQGGSSGCQAGNFTTASLTINSSIQPPVTRTSVDHGNFTNTSTWDCSCVPAEGENIVINHFVTFDTDFTVGSGNTMVVNTDNLAMVGSGNTLEIVGSFTNNGLVDGAVKVTGNPTALVLGEIGDVEFDATGSVDLTGNTNINGQVLLTGGTVNTGGNEFAIVSSDTHTGSILPGAGAINGDVTIQRYIPSDNGHHYLSAPCSDLTVADFDDDWNLNLAAPFPYLYYYDESITDWVTPSSTAHLLNPGQGYTGWIPAGTTVDVTGTINSGDIEVFLTNGGTSESGWNFIGNPYPSSIDWDLVTTPNEMSTAIYVWDHDQNAFGSYAVYFDGISTNGGSNIVPHSQGFFVNTTATTSLTFQDNDRVSAEGVFLRTTRAGDDPLIRLALSGQGHSIESVMRFRDGASEAYVNSEDALYFPTGNPTGIEFATESLDEQNLVINTLPIENMNTTVPVFATIGTNGQYAIEMTEMENFSENIQVVLVDNKLGVEHLLNDGPYNFAGDASDDAHRFHINTSVNTVSGLVDLTPESEVVDVVGYYFNDQLNIKFGAPIKANTKVSVYNLLGQNVLQANLEQGSSHFVIEADHLENNAVYLLDIHGSSKVIKIVAVY